MHARYYRGSVLHASSSTVTRYWLVRSSYSVLIIVCYMGLLLCVVSAKNELSSFPR